MVDSAGAVSAKQLERELGVTYKTAWRMGRVIRARLAEPDNDLADLSAARKAAVAAAQAGARSGRPAPASVGSTRRPPGFIYTFAGDGTPAYGGDGWPASAAQLRSPHGIAVDGDGSVYIADEGNHVIRKVDAGGLISTVAGDGTPGYSGDGGRATEARLHGPTGVALDGSGNVLVADHQNHVVRRIDPTGTIVTVAGNGGAGFSGDGGPATEARLDWPGRVLPLDDGLLISDYRNNRIRKVDAAGIITTVAGNDSPTTSGDGGLATNAGLVRPGGMALHPDGTLYVAQACDPDTPDARVRRITPSGAIETFAGGLFGGFAGDGGPASLAWLSNPVDVVIDPEGGLLIADLRNNRIRRVDPRGTIRTVAGTGHSGFGGNGGLAAAGQLNRPAGLALAPGGDLLIADSWNNRIRTVTAQIAGSHAIAAPGAGIARPINDGIPAVIRGDSPIPGNGSQWPMPFPFASP